MSDRRTCPQCGCYDTERVDVQLDWSPDSIETTRVCNECNVVYSVVFGPPTIRLDQQATDAARLAMSDDSSKDGSEEVVLTEKGIEALLEVDEMPENGGFAWVGPCPEFSKELSIASHSGTELKLAVSVVERGDFSNDVQKGIINTSDTYADHYDTGSDRRGDAR